MKWNLNDLYHGIDDPCLQSDLENARSRAIAFEEKYDGKLSYDFSDAIDTYEQIEEALGKIMSFGYLLFSEDMSNESSASFYQTLSEKCTDISSHLLFFPLAINDLDPSLCTPHRYDPWLREMRVLRPFQLTKELEKLLHDKNLTSNANWFRLHEETFAHLRFGEQRRSISEILNALSDRDPNMRRIAAVDFSEKLKENIPLFTLIFNTLIKDKEITDKWRGFSDPVASRNLANQVENRVVEALFESVKKAYPRLSHRYYALKAKLLGQNYLNYWDRNAPFPQDDASAISWEEAQGIVLHSYRDFSPQLGDLAQDFFDQKWIHSTLIPGKDSGAFAHPTVPSVHPYILLNYHGKTRDVMTLAHELGHGIHQRLAAPQGYLMANTPLTIAETASVFGEMLTFQTLLKRSTPQAQKTIIASKIEDMLNTVVRQISFFDFERRIHLQRRHGELSSDKIGKIWMETQQESLGPAFQLEENYQYFWTYISHFMHTPFYVYAYAFGDCLVNALYATYESGFPDFEAHYIDLLKAGGTLRHAELLAPFELDASDPAFWNKGLSVIDGLITQLEHLTSF